MTKIKSWESIEQELGSNISQFNDWLNEQTPEEVTILVTGIFEKDYEEFENEKKGNT